MDSVVIDNFTRTWWMLVGAAMAIPFTAIAGWPSALGWLIGWGSSNLFLFALTSRRVVFHRRARSQKPGNIS